MTAQGKNVHTGDLRGLPVGLFFLVGSPAEWRPGGLESGLYPLPLTSGSVLDLSLPSPQEETVVLTPILGTRSQRNRRGGMTNAKVAQEMATLSART